MGDDVVHLACDARAFRGDGEFGVGAFGCLQGGDPCLVGTLLRDSAATREPERPRHADGEERGQEVDQHVAGAVTADQYSKDEGADAASREP